MDEVIAVALIAGIVLGTALWLAALTPRGRQAASVGLLLALGLIAVMTLLPTGSVTASVNLDPGAGLAAPWRSPTSAVNIVGNLLLFVPLGVALPACLPVLRSPVLAVPVAAAVSVLVELTQYAYVAGRATDVNDVLLNTAGALAGLVAFRAVRAVTDRTPVQA